jgi:iron complex transport system ATP-binding protein
VNAITLLNTHGMAIGYREPRHETRVLASDLSLTLHAGELVCLIGPNGVGKSTLIRTLAGMQTPLAGQVELAGRNLSSLSAHERAQHLAVVLTERISVGMLTSYLMVSLGRHPHTGWTGRLTAEDHEVVRWSLLAVGAEELATRPVTELSDGERQKVMIARALAQEPVLLILDEPTAFLDLPRRIEVMRVLRHLAHTTGRAILLSTHDLDLALRSADRLWLMAMDGSLIDGGPEDLVLNGGIEAAFRSERMAFDAESGSFRLSAVARGTAAVTGEGLPARWAARALERVGYRLVTSAQPADVQVAVSHRGGIPTYLAKRAEASREFSRLQEMVRWLNGQTRAPSDLQPMRSALQQAVESRHDPREPASA